MPLPKPKTDETQADFIERCMADEAMKDEYPDTDQRLAVCSQQWSDKDVKAASNGPVMCRRDVAIELADIRLEQRAGKATQIVGYGAVFYDGTPETEYELWPGVRERIAPTAFDRALANKDDVRGLFNHEPDNLLGRTSSGTMQLSADKKGLLYGIDPGDTNVGRDVMQHIQRGDLTGSSFMFGVEKESYEELEDGDEIRTIESVRPLYDVGPVTFPAYEGASTGLRGRELEAARRSIEAWRSKNTPESRAELEAAQKWVDDNRQDRSKCV